MRKKLAINIEGFWQSENAVYFYVAILAAMSFCLLYGVKILNFQYVDWLFDGMDLSQHYLGWKAYRNGAWTFPIGLTDQLAYPNYTSVIFTDSIPIFAVIFKVLSPILPDKFQYFALWGIMCFVLQSCLAARIVKKFTDNRTIIILSGLLVLVSPVMLWRMYAHTALAGQWILLFMLYPLLAYEEYKNDRQIYLEVAIAGFLVSAVHMYFGLICGIILVGIALRDFLENKKIARVIFLFADYIVVILLTVWVLGGFYSQGTSFKAGGLGHFSMNYNALYNPQGWSIFLKDQPQFTNGQYEGFGYLGAGGLLLCTVVLINVLGNSNFKEWLKREWRTVLSVAAVIIGILIVAASPIGSFNNIKVYELHLPKAVIGSLEIFRAAGRIVMLLPYVFILSAIIIGSKAMAKRSLILLLAVCLIFQAADLSSKFKGIHHRFKETVTYTLPLGNKNLWDRLAGDVSFKHMVVTYWADNNRFYNLAEYATTNAKTLNAFWMVHPNTDKILKNVKEQLANPADDEMFIFNKNDWQWTKYNNLHFYSAGDFLIGTLNEIEGEAEIKELPIISTELIGNRNLKNGSDKNGKRTIHPDGLSFGPYCYVPQGKYLIRIKGNSLQDNVNVSVTSNKGAQCDYSVTDMNNSEIKIMLLADKAIDDVEILISNISSQDIVIDSMTIEKLR